ncbi:tigger transposable element-derived protein 1-like isoform X2 [Saccopteryx bilineata]|uniref:tigger transposable element-derived protein 1-like isoform X2 n=1 Tax=Saccopteryx bilineata TaxID=59482 RepID=UPI00338F0FB1
MFFCLRSERNSEIPVLSQKLPQGSSISSTKLAHLVLTCYPQNQVESRALYLFLHHFCIFYFFLCAIMGPKKVSVKDSGEKKKRMMSIEVKQEIIEKHERGVRVIELARLYDRNASTICTILKQKDAIKSANPAKGTTILSQLRTNIHEEMEKLLLVWVKEKELAGDTVTETVICEKARIIYSDLKKKEPSTSKETAKDTFKASHGWFENFKKRSGIHSVVRHGETASADVKAAEEYITQFAALITKEGYIPQEVFNCDGTGLFWKKMPRRTFITAEEKKPPGHKPIKDPCSEEEVESQEVISTSEIKDMLAMWEKLSSFIEKKHPAKVSTGRVSALFNDTCLSHFRNILKGRQQQTSLDRSLFKSPASESAESAAKKCCSGIQRGTWHNGQNLEKDFPYVA